MANFLYFWDFWGEFCWEGFGATLPELRTLDVVLQMDTRAQINPVSTNQKRETRSENRNSQLLRTEHSRSKFKKFVKLKRLKRLKLWRSENGFSSWRLDWNFGLPNMWKKAAATMPKSSPDLPRLRRNHLRDMCLWRNNLRDDRKIHGLEVEKYQYA